MNLLRSLFLTGIIFAVVGMYPMYAFAQNNANPNPAQPNNPGGTTNQTQPNNPGGNTGGTTGSGFDNRWLIPLIGIPLILLLWASSMATDDTHRMTTMGTKGGRRRTTVIEDNTNDNEE